MKNIISYFPTLIKMTKFLNKFDLIFENYIDINSKKKKIIGAMNTLGQTMIKNEKD
jgi:hypothetical protein